MRVYLTSGIIGLVCFWAVTVVAWHPEDEQRIDRAPLLQSLASSLNVTH